MKTLIQFLSWSGLVLSANLVAQEKVTAQQFVDLQEGNNPFAGFRRAHAKGACITGEFVSNGALAPYTKATLFEAGTPDFVGRFSIAGSNPTAPDLKAPVRSLALSFDLSSTEQWRIAMNTPPAMAVTNAHDFYQQIVAIKQGPNAIKAFFNEHPESKDFLNWKASYTPSSSFALEQYNSINAFYLIDNQNNKQAVRWHVMPRDNTPNTLTNSDNALFDELASRLANGAVSFNWVFTLASNDDDETNPAVIWPSSREQVSAGVLKIKAIDASEDARCHDINFDPLTLPTGIAATQDPILNARSAAYTESYRRRAKEKLLEALQ
ncbi:catalase family peroxidase [Pseudoalteromonas sp. T1lg24]|uniref:catalase family peroxidase n=1 Tax=Pseudoalteromonas sp. T1lg24 TaxID=2077099 RepID=UPI000CF649D7|nr:catalase family peroxidase [Pseudoalteromonas sp. T1lg24]